MKLNFFPFVISSLISLLIAFLFFVINAEILTKSMQYAYSLSAFIISFSTLTFAFPIQYKSPRLGVNIKLVSIIFFLVLIVSNFLLSVFLFSINWLLIIIGIELLIFLLIIYYLSKTEQ